MCGINGIVHTRRSERLVNRERLERMRDVISHRGPDGIGAYVDANIGLGHRRLAIVDLATGGQPMFNSDRSCVIVYNGEVYNHAENRTDLARLGYEYRTASDTETILHLYQEFGTGCVDRLRGMFAFAIWDKTKDELFIARDRFGVKPLYYVHQDDGSLYFASEIKSLIEAGAVMPELNYAVLPDLLANHGTTGDETLFNGVRRLPAGNFMTWREGELKIVQYWDLEFGPKQPILNEADAIAQWSEMFRKAVKLRLMSDVPLGMFLSGGIDSSAIAAVMSGLVDGPIKTFSVGFKEREANEFRYARQVAEKFRTEHREITITPDEFFAELPRLVWHEDGPLGFEASVPLYFVSKLASEHVKVVLTGEGSDETLAGYGRYAKALTLLGLGERYEAVTPQQLRGVVRSGVAVLPHSLNKKLKRTFLSIDANIESLYFDNFSIFSRELRNGLFSPDADARIAESYAYANLGSLVAKKGSDSLLDRLLYVDSKTYLHELLMKQDRMSMAASIESRVPFLDHKLVEFTATLPDSMKLRRRETKWILRKAMTGVLPPEIISRPKMGFPVPLSDWLRGRFSHLVDEYLFSDRSLSRGIFNTDSLRRLVAEHRSGRDHSTRIFKLMNLEIWHRVFIDGEIAK